MKADQELRSLKRGLKVLALLNQTENVSITELARHLELPRTTAERIMLTLLAEGYVQRVPNDKRYRLSPKVCSLAGGFSQDCWIVQAAGPMLLRVTEQIGWPLAIAAPSSDHMVLRSTTDSSTSLWLARRRVGAETPILNSSSGLVAYAFSSEAEQNVLRHLLMQSSDPYNRERAANRQALDLLIQPVLENGFAFQPPPNNNPERSIAFPIFVNGKYAASLLMIFITRAMSSATVIEKYAPHLRTLAGQIGRAASAHEELEYDSAIPFPTFLSGRAPVAGFAHVPAIGATHTPTGGAA
ncbi:helix-turn-helix domain-containing protein [Sphingomonas sp. AR_OL41]|uniref:helix-turn-helix domain-containing protein n=1 Tax=Sphingomonas sp. AR_OL41 TaxID=3042729 RepID=UPI0024817C23|nr:helix-turn-helix domain-containing protein [Sphingomonas sp. AR_OL41]MDH7973222.1 helix-turn-helix domain-containing protein [Sphingomonas sp. AR_OL41]